MNGAYYLRGEKENLQVFLKVRSKSANQPHDGTPTLKQNKTKTRNQTTHKKTLVHLTETT